MSWLGLAQGFLDSSLALARLHLSLSVNPDLMIVQDTTLEECKARAERISARRRLPNGTSEQLQGKAENEGGGMARYKEQ